MSGLIRFIKALIFVLNFKIRGKEISIKYFKKYTIILRRDPSTKEITLGISKNGVARDVTPLINRTYGKRTSSIKIAMDLCEDGKCI